MKNSTLFDRWRRSLLRALIWILKLAHYNLNEVLYIVHYCDAVVIATAWMIFIWSHVDIVRLQCGSLCLTRTTIIIALCTRRQFLQVHNIVYFSLSFLMPLSVGSTRSWKCMFILGCDINWQIVNKIPRVLLYTNNSIE